jgi:hypothetical protein
MTTQPEIPSFEAVVEMARSFCNDENIPDVDFLTLITTLLLEIHENWEGIPDTTKAIMVGVTSVLIKHTMKTGEFQAAMDDLLQPNATRQ